MLCHPFPPTGGAGVQRSTKFVKYLPQFGWRPVVVTVREGIYLQRDESLLREVPPDTPVIRTGTFEPPERAALELRAGAESAGGLKSRLVRATYRTLISPDRQLLWLPHAFPAAVRAIRRYRPRVIYATGNPYSSFLLARLLGAATGRPYVLDFRDAWTLNWYSWRFQPGADRRRAAIEAAQERWALRGAAAAIFMSEQVREDYAKAYPELAVRFHKLSNGFDPDDFAGVAPRRLGGFSFVYTGKLMPYRPPDPFLRGLAEAIAREPALGAAARAYFVGDWRPEHQAAADRLGVGHLVRAVGYVPHHEAVAYMLGASALALISGGDRTEQPGKVFEYLAADRPILALIPSDGASAEIVRASTAGGYFADPTDSLAVAEAILRLWHDRARAPGPADATARSRYDRRALTRRLAEILSAVGR